MKRRNRVRRHGDQKGSALLVSLMVMVALSLLGVYSNPLINPGM